MKFSNGEATNTIISRLIIIPRRYTCVYLACKVEEFNVSIMQFCGNLNPEQDRQKNQEKQEKNAEFILGHELLVMQQLNFQLTVHNPFRPLEGLLIDLKVSLSCCVAIRCQYMFNSVIVLPVFFFGGGMNF